MRKAVLSFLIPLTFCGCITDFGETPVVNNVDGLRPIYVPTNEAKSISAAPPQPILHLGKIYYKDQTIFVNESNLGVHIIDNTDPANPVKKGFLRIPGCHDIAIKGNTLYADNVGDLVAIDISDLTNPKVLKRLEGIQGTEISNYPQFYEGYFECVDESKGMVVGWENADLLNPKCWR